MATGGRTGAAVRSSRCGWMTDTPASCRKTAASPSAGAAGKRPVVGVEPVRGRLRAAPGRWHGAAAVAHLTAHGHQVPVVSASETPDDVVQAIEAGARGYLSKQAGEAEILGAIRAVAEARTYVSATLSPASPSSTVSPPASPNTGSWPPRRAAGPGHSAPTPFSLHQQELDGQLLERLAQPGRLRPCRLELQFVACAADRSSDASHGYLSDGEEAFAAGVHGGGHTDQITNPGPARASSYMHRSPGEELPQYGGEDVPGHVVVLAFEGAVPWVGKCGGERLRRVGCPGPGFAAI